MAAVDRINLKEGRGAIRIGRIPEKPKWAVRRAMLSLRYTICWHERIGVRG
ncbi:DUF4113 domain-containing protein [Pseudomonas shahriarae]|jgi:DNA polymerase V|uniref:DUF4113 domain-containing protein n=1 Tax=Pseudomonas shahriarae TaxID=2745512 RepID=A0A9X4C4A0_9PSED|nr:MULTISPECIES: DUF4113 domain-containing protein [Pseudomonas]MDD1009668.1 DUF4113 domain-containing protein [Pseudomonas shahriarae]